MHWLFDVEFKDDQSRYRLERFPGSKKGSKSARLRGL
jgi:hypothetical protein